MSMKEDPGLSRLLKEARHECEIPANFQTQVWNKISLRADQRRNSSLTGLWERFRDGLLEPRYGFSFAALVIVIGLALGQIQASVEARHAWSSLEGKYVASIDPYAQSGHGQHR